MKATFLVLVVSALASICRADEPSVLSPNKRFSVVLREAKSDAAFPVIVLKESQTGRETEVFDYDSVGQGTSALHAVWSPDSRYVALTIAVGPATQEFAVYRISSGSAEEVEILPIPKAFDADTYGHRGGPSVDRWEDSRTLWVHDGQKNRSFRYRITAKGKLLADGFKESKLE